MFSAARSGKDTFEVAEGSFRESARLARRREELDNPPDEMFAYVNNPALALAGTRDLNVAPHHAACEVAVMQSAGNLRSRAVLIEGADHNFQVAPTDQDQAFRQRYTFSSFNRPYHPQLDREVIEWLEDVARAPGHHHNDDHERPASRTIEQQALYSRAVQGPETDPRTATSPERLHLAPGLTLIDDILDRKKTVGVDTLEGFIGPLLRTTEIRAHFIDMPAGLYLDEHPHAKGSIIYTVRGSWGLKSLGRWHLMKPGSLYWFGDNIPTDSRCPLPRTPTFSSSNPLAATMTRLL